MPLASAIPEEVLYEILKLLVQQTSLSQTSVKALPSDIIAAALTCRSWLAVAHPLINQCLQRPFMSSAGLDLLELRRLHDLLLEARHLGLNYGEIIEDIDIIASKLWTRDVRSTSQESGGDKQGFADEVLESIASIMSMAPNIKALFFDFCDTDAFDIMFNDVIRLYSCLGPFCGNVQRLWILMDMSWKAWEYQLDCLLPHLTNLVHVEFLSGTPDIVSVRALAQHTGIERAYFHRTVMTNLGDCIAGWPNLLQLHITESYGYNSFGLLNTIGKKCPRLRGFTCGDTSYYRHYTPNSPINYYMAKIVERCPDLTHLDFSNNQRLDDAFLERAIRTGRALRRINISKCTNIRAAPGGMWASVREPWPRLEYLNIYACEKISREFVERVVPVCSKLARIVLPNHLEADAGIIKVLETQGFREHAEGWERVVGSGMAEDG
ncbi:hypothetical protein BC936DRAFT_145315 [Jimgerdemannia flammicorona]|uniref:F-box domain-containing protein n=1 Tax=Jimgerdemannia flammicorona TaxID=994334 RepID=A0A433DAB1_9FUNG|nr:hypothetical protein BC936DRAFT_145315 [Jimgerdemannia flammicorona]